MWRACLVSYLELAQRSNLGRLAIVHQARGELHAVLARRRAELREVVVVVGNVRELRLRLR